MSRELTALIIFLGSLWFFALTCFATALVLDTLRYRRQEQLTERAVRTGQHPRTGHVSASPVLPPATGGRAIELTVRRSSSSTTSEAT